MSGARKVIEILVSVGAVGVVAACGSSGSDAATTDRSSSASATAVAPAPGTPTTQGADRSSPAAGVAAKLGCADPVPGDPSQFPAPPPTSLVTCTYHAARISVSTWASHAELIGGLRVIESFAHDAGGIAVAYGAEWSAMPEVRGTTFATRQALAHEIAAAAGASVAVYAAS